MRDNNPSTLIEESIPWMESIRWALNSDSPIKRGEVRRLVNAWNDADRDLEKLLRGDDEIYKEVAPYIYGDKGVPEWQAFPFPKGSGLQVMVFPRRINPPVKIANDLVVDEARLMFMNLLINPLRDKLSSGPCSRCDNYFLKKRTNHKVYCSRRCARLASADASNRKKLDENREAKVKRAKGLARKWDELRIRPNKAWKQWIHSQDKEITPKWLTRAVARFDEYGLEPPKKEDVYAAGKW